MRKRNTKAKELIDATIPASTPPHIRDWLKAMAAGDYASCETVQGTAPSKPTASVRRPTRRRPRPVGGCVGKSA